MSKTKKRSGKPYKDYKGFVIKANLSNITYETLLEAEECIRNREIGKMFRGYSTQSGSDYTLHPGTINSWLLTFEIYNDPSTKEYVPPNPNHSRNGGQDIIKIGTLWDDYVDLINTPIPEDQIDYWKKLRSCKKLGDEAVKHGLTWGIRKIKIENLLKKMIDMYERRKKNLWNKADQIDENNDNPEETIENNNEYKPEEINYFENDETIKIPSSKYKPMNVLSLKSLAKKRGLTDYNNLDRDGLIKLHEEFDNDVKTEERKIGIVQKDELNTVFKFNNYEIQAIGTIDNPLFILKHVAQILGIKNHNSIKLDANMKEKRLIITAGGPQYMDVINKDGLYSIAMKLKTPEVQEFKTFIKNEMIKLDEKHNKNVKKYKEISKKRPIEQVMSLDDLDIEAENLEAEFDENDRHKFTNKVVLYMAYIGNKLVKIGFSNYNFTQREAKHLMNKSDYSQFRIIKVFEISSGKMETKIHELLSAYKVDFGKQREIFKVKTTLTNLIKFVEQALIDNDAEKRLNDAIIEINILKDKLLEMKELENENLRLKLELASKSQH